MEAKEIKIKYTRNIEKIHEIEVGDWVDLRVAIDTYMTEGELYHIPLGVAMQLPEGYEALVIPRSSTFKKYGIVQANSVGLIDEAYCDDKSDSTFRLKITVTTEDHQINYVMLKRNDFFLSNLRYLFERGCFRFKDLKCKEAVLHALSY